MKAEKKKVLIVIDVQNDFVTGSLGTPEAQAIIPNVKEKFDEYKNNKNYVILTKDTHHSDYADTSEGRKLPEHCMYGTKGWANVEELIQGIAKNNPGFNKEILEEIVRTDNKQRYSFNDDKILIRANQGHSIPVDVELEEKEPPKILYHGTGEKYIASIDQNGLIPKSRLYVHLSKDVETAKAVGKRHGKEVVYSINSEQMYKDGYKFYLSKNGVWLTKRVPVKYVMKEV